MEIEQDEIVGHHHAMKEVQYIEVEPEQKYEKTRIKVESPDDGEYRLQFQDPVKFKYSFSDPIKAKASAGQFKNAVKQYYRQKFGSDITVTRVPIYPPAPEPEPEPEAPAENEGEGEGQANGEGEGNQEGE